MITLDELNGPELYAYARQLGINARSVGVDLAELREEVRQAARLAPDRTPPGRLL